LRPIKKAVTAALKSLEEKRLIHYEPYGYITLTREGRKFAKEIIRIIYYFYPLSTASANQD
jgi:Mn-dependent DtxR family transcriptional regulator